MVRNITIIFKSFCYDMRGKVPEEVQKNKRTFAQDCSPGGGGVLPSNRLMGMRRWMGSHFHDWIDYNGVAFSIE